MAKRPPQAHDCRDLRFQRAFLSPRYWPTWLGLAVFVVLSWLPMRARAFIGARLGDLAYRRNQKRRNIVRLNLGLCFPQLSVAEREAWVRRHFQIMGLAVMDYALLWFGSRRRIRSVSVLIGEEHLRRLREQGRNVIIMAGHSAALDFGPMRLGDAGYPLVGPYNAGKNAVVDWLMARGRCRFGKQLFERDTGMLALARMLKQGDVLFYLPDEDLGPRVSVFAPFFGVPKATLYALGKLARIGNAAVIPCMSFYNADRARYETHLLPPLEPFPTGDAQADAQAQNAALETLIRRFPEQYLWTLKLFKTRPDGAPSPYKRRPRPPADAAA